MDVEEIDHAHVFGARDAFERGDHGGRARTVQHRPKCEAAGHRIGVWFVVEQDQNAIGVSQVALVLLDARPCQGTAELGEERRFEELGQRQVRDIGKLVAHRLCALLAILVGDADPEDVDERAARIANGLDHLVQVLPAGVFDDDAGLGGDVGLQVGVRALHVAGRHGQAGSLELARERAALDQELHLDAGGQDLVEHPDHQFVLANGQTPHM